MQKERHTLQHQFSRTYFAEFELKIIEIESGLNSSGDGCYPITTIVNMACDMRRYIVCSGRRIIYEPHSAFTEVRLKNALEVT